MCAGSLSGAMDRGVEGAVTALNGGKDRPVNKGLITKEGLHNKDHRSMDKIQQIIEVAVGDGRARQEELNRGRVL